MGFDISVLEMMNIGALDALGKHAAETLLKRALEESGANAEGHATS